jgi:uncharacterized protein
MLRGVGVLTMALAAALAGPVQADEAKEREIARAVIELAGSADRMEVMLDTMLPAVVESARVQGGLGEAQARRYGELFAEEFRSDMPAIIDMSAAAYAEAFSEAELTDMRTFFASPTGQALRARGSELTASMTRAGMVVGERASARAIARLRRELEAPEDKS